MSQFNGKHEHLTTKSNHVVRRLLYDDHQSQKPLLSLRPTDR